MTSRRAYWSGIIMLALAGCGYGVMAPLVRIANGAVPPFLSIVIRYLIVSVVMAIIITLRREWHQIIPRSRYDAVFIVLVGLVGAGLSNVAFTMSVLTTSIGHAVFLFSLYAVVTPLLSGFIIHQWPTRSQWLALLVAMIGMALLTGIISTAFTTGMGDFLAIAGAVIVSFQYVGTRVMRFRSAAVIALYLSLGSVAAGLPGIFIFEWPVSAKEVVLGVTIVRSPYAPWLGLAAVLLFAATNLTVNLLVSQGFKVVSAGFGGVLLLLEPVVGLLAGIAFFGESPSQMTLIGAALILLGGAIAVSIGGKEQPVLVDSRESGSPVQTGSSF